MQWMLKQARSSCKRAAISGWYERMNFLSTGMQPWRLAVFFLQGFLFCSSFNLESPSNRSYSSLTQLHLSLSAVSSASVIFSVRSVVLLAVSILMLSGAGFQEAPLCIVTQVFCCILKLNIIPCLILRNRKALQVQRWWHVWWVFVLQIASLL